MDKNKELKDFLPDKNSVFFRSFDNVVKENIINKAEIIEKIKTVFDPEIPVNIYDLGLVYNIDIDSDNNIGIKMTLTTPNCPVADSMPKKVGESLVNVKGISSIKVELVWNPKWSKDMMSEDAKLALDIL